MRSGFVNLSLLMAWSCTTTVRENPYFAGKQLADCPIKVPPGVFAVASDPDINSATSNAKQQLINEFGFDGIDLKPKRETICVNPQGLIQVTVGISKTDALVFRGNSLKFLSKEAQGKFAQLKRAVMAKAYDLNWARVAAIFQKNGVELPSSGAAEALKGPSVALVFDADLPQNVQNGIKDAISDLGLTYKVADLKAGDLIVTLKTSEEILPPQVGSNHCYVRLIVNMTFTVDSPIKARDIEPKKRGLPI